MPYTQNIPYIRLFAACKDALFMVPMVIVYYAMKGVTLPEFMLIQGLFRLSAMAAEPLVSYLADRNGRKAMAITGASLWVAAHLVLLLGHGFWMVLAAELLFGLAIAMTMSSVEALLYDSLLAEGQQSTHLTHLTQMRSWQAGAAGMALFIGGFAYTWHPDLPLLLETAVGVLAILVLYQLRDVPHSALPQHTQHPGKPPLKEVFTQARHLLGTPHMLAIILFPGLVGSFTVVLFWALQPTLTGQGLSPEGVGMFMCAYFGFRALFATKVERLMRTVGTQVSLLLPVVALPVGYLALAWLPWYAAMPLYMCSCGFAHILADCLGRDQLNHTVASRLRASAISVYQQVGRVCGFITLSLATCLTGTLSLPETLSVMAALSAITLLPVWRHTQRHRVPAAA